MGGGTTGRILTGIATMGGSETLRLGTKTLTKALTPKIPGIPEVPQKGDVGQDDETRRKDRKRKGRKSTILTGNQTVINPLGEGNGKGVLG